MSLVDPVPRGFDAAGRLPILEANLPDFTIWGNDNGIIQRLWPGTARPRLADNNGRVVEATASVTGRTRTDTDGNQWPIHARAAVEPAQPHDPNCTRPLEVFEATDINAAWAYYHAALARGITSLRAKRVMARRLWNFPGPSEFLDLAGRRLGFTQVLTDRARQNPEIKDAATVLAGLRETDFRTPRTDPITAPRAKQVQGSLDHAEQACKKLHALAAAAALMIDEAHEAYGLDAPVRTYAVACTFDPRPEPPEPPELVGLRAEVERLKAENADLAEKLTAPAKAKAPR